ncbi:MAG TPA: tetratricopeptide repeat protein [Candidatus Moranbacteria bacterium]|nr:tetratricopeptide repeat protein [Candidatus Moranbacteria bacterium]
MFYLYFVLPPVIIVASLALIIFLVSRKSLEIEKKIVENGVNEESESQLSMEVKSRSLYFLEKIAHWFKIFSLKMHNWLEEKLKFIKQRKTKIDLNKKKNGKENIEKGEILLEKNDEKESKAVTPEKKKIIGKIFENIRERKAQKKKMQEIKSVNVEKERATEIFKQKAMISDKAVYPEDKKEELENILIERIAIDPRDIEAYERLGDYYISQKNYKDAKECYRQVLKLNPRSASIKKKLENFGR